MKSVCFAFLSLALLCSCSTTRRTVAQDFIGTWDAAADIGDGKTGMIVWQVTGTHIIQTIQGRSFINTYDIKYSSEPVELNYCMGSIHVPCIVEFLGKDRIRVAGPKGYQQPRPTDFEDAECTLTFNRTYPVTVDSML